MGSELQPIQSKEELCSFYRPNLNHFNLKTASFMCESQFNKHSAETIESIKDYFDPQVNIHDSIQQNYKWFALRRF